MRTNRESDVARRAPEERPDAPVPAPVVPATAAQLLALQRTAGNAAVARAIGDGPVTPAAQRRRIAIPPGRRPPPAAPGPQTPVGQRAAVPIAPGRAAPPAPPGQRVLVPAAVLEQAAGNGSGNVVEVPAEDVYAYEEQGAAPDLVAVVDVDDLPVRGGDYIEVGGDAPAAGDESDAEESPYVPGRGGGEDEWDAEADGEASPYRNGGDGASAYRNVSASIEEVERVVGPEVVGQAVAGAAVAPHALVQDGAARPNRIRPAKYRTIPLNETRRKYRGEDASSKDFIIGEVFREAAKEVKLGRKMEDVLKEAYGWTDADVENHFRQGPGSAKVDYLDEARREDFELHLGGRITQGRDGRVFDTGPMFSKFLGKGFGIYAMDGSGAFYADAHRVGLFHHSSFVHGGEVAGAGELRVEDGALKHISNKSGHYQPGRDEMMQVLEELIEQGVSLAGVGITIVEKGDLAGALGAETTFDGTAQQFYDRHTGGAAQ